MTAAQVVVWPVGLVVVVACAVLAVVTARRPTRVGGLLGLLPIVLGGLAIAFDVVVPAPQPAWATGMAIAVALLGVVGGGPATSVILDLSTQHDMHTGDHGGIVILSAPTPSGALERHEVLRGGAAIGYLERVAVMGAIVLGHLSIVAAVIAIKGLGRFSELDNAEARERFIIGTLASLLWAGACGALIVLTR
ncbi:hypothetical protein [Curtobacterium sp. Leaf261]|uniref:hypothetical protein n=1 Tax=Curtobacterium sp. Leaf261 TaxID=1736311 RepID=UPI0006F8A581|nr:hypothetical protein [Curtobacterium sp. Leaf261]KQO64895.1 hypothetical protein ASF23_01615 [Curtobacterium sp. Leaf261]